MLPDFPVLKAELHKLLVLGASAERPGRPEISHLLVVLPRHPRHEGDRGILVRESGEEEEIPFSTYTAEDVLDLSEVDLPTLRETYDTFRDLASETDEQVSADQDELVNSTAESIGNVDSTGDELPALIRQYPLFALLFICVYPHRTNAPILRWLNVKLKEAVYGTGT